MMYKVLAVDLINIKKWRYKVKSRFLKLLTMLGVLGGSLVWFNPVSADPLISCTMTYQMSGYSLAIKVYDGTGVISCSNGQHQQVSLSSRSIGFTIGKSEIDGTGVFSGVKSLNEIYGTFAALEGHAGATTSVDGQVLTRGEISLALSGKGRGIDIGVTIGELTISAK